MEITSDMKEIGFYWTILLATSVVMTPLKWQDMFHWEYVKYLHIELF